MRSLRDTAKPSVNSGKTDTAHESDLPRHGCAAPAPGELAALAALLARTFHTCVAADVSRRHFGFEKNAPTDVGGYTLSANRAECEPSGLGVSFSRESRLTAVF